MNSDVHDLDAYTASGSEPAFRRIVERHLQMVQGVACRLTGSEALAEEIAQSVFILLARKARGVRGSHLSGWLHGATRRMAINAVRKELRRTRMHQNYFETMSEKTATDASWEEIAGHLDHAVAKLPADDRELVLLRYFEGMSFTEISVATGRSVEACKKRGQRALERLAALLGKQGVPVGGSSLAGLLVAAPVFLPAPASAATISALSVKTAALTPGFSLFLKIMTTKQITAVSAAIILALAAIPAAIMMNRPMDPPPPGNSLTRGHSHSRPASTEPGQVSHGTVPARKESSDARAINWEELARTKFSSRNRLIRAQEAKSLAERLLDLSDDALVAGLDAVASLDIGQTNKWELSLTLVNELSKRDPMRVLDRMSSDQEEFGTMICVLGFKALVEKDPASADAWLQKQGNNGMLKDSQLDLFESMAVGNLLDTDPGAATRRIMAYPEDRQVEILATSTDYDFTKAFDTAMGHYQRTGDDQLLNKLIASDHLERATHIENMPEKYQAGGSTPVRELINRIPDETVRNAALERMEKASKENISGDVFSADILNEKKR